MFDKYIADLDNALHGHNKALLGFSWKKNMWYMYVLDFDKAGRIPVLEESRDRLDWELKMSAWEKAGTIIFAVDESFEAMLLHAFTSLGKQ